VKGNWKMNKTEPTFLGIPRADWWPVVMHMTLSALTLYLLAKILPFTLCILTFAWIVVGRALLVKHGAISIPYPRSLGGAVLAFLMAAVWPYFCHMKK